MSFFTKPIIEAGSLQVEALEKIASRVAVLDERVDELRDWIDFGILADEFATEGLGALHAAMLRRPELKQNGLPNIVRRCVLQTWADHVAVSVPLLRDFRTENHDALIREFRQLDRKHATLGSQRVIAAAENHRPTNAFLVGGEAALLRREANKKRKHLPLRKLFAGMPNLLTRLKPVLLMSPLSVSLFLDPEQIQFDLVVFDEASQVCAEDAVGAIYRGKQLVICGDNRQLPPTSFFEQGMADDFEDDQVETFDVFESILDECAAINLPQLRLRWHYRSRHESLIAFSNHRFYGDQPLVTFPAARHEDETLGVKFVHVPDGVYDRSGRRDNEKEADRVVDLAMKHLRYSPHRSLGIVTFSVAQRDAIDDRLERMRKNYPEIEEFFARERPERVFVKNLESVQGDERDVIIFSVGYGRDRAGKLTMHFGPLNQEGGERRLNVAITRAREQVIVVSSIRAADMDVAATTRPGVLNLHRYLDYAERGVATLDTEAATGDGDFESPLEESVASAIRSLGYEAHPQVGCSGYRIDLGVVDPAWPGRFILGVECDGAMYHSAWSARDRDRLRQEQLERLGWKLHRIWGPDWVARRDTELKRLADAIERTRTYVPGSDQPKTPEGVGMRASVVVECETACGNAEDPFSSWAISYEVARPRLSPPHGVQFHEIGARSTLAQMLDEVVTIEGPVHFELAARRMAACWGLQRVGSRMLTAVEKAARLILAQGTFEIRGNFIWPKNSAGKLRVRRPVPERQETFRDIEHIPPEETELAMTELVCLALSLTEDELVGQTARVFGFDRTGGRIRTALAETVERAVQQGIIVRRGDRLVPAPKRDSALTDR